MLQLKFKTEIPIDPLQGVGGRIFLSILLILSLTRLHATTWSVGPTRTYTYCSQVAPLVQNGDTIEIDAAIYINDPQVIWNKNNLVIIGIGGTPRLQAGSIIANDMVNGKGIFVVSGQNVKVENIEFANAVVQDNNGAGIRQEGANLHVTHCRFDANEMGILAGNISNCKTIVEHCEFINGGSPLNPGYQHNIYINHIDTLVFQYNYSHDAIAEGHEFKSRAAYNFILYNRIANESSEDSRTIDLPNGGTSVIIGNVIEQGPNSANSNILGYGQEGLTNAAPHELYCINNTFINKKSTGNFIQIPSGTSLLFLRNNIFAGAQTSGLIQGTAAVIDSSHNHINTDFDIFSFNDEGQFDYHLSSGSIDINAGISIPGFVAGRALQPDLEYKDQSNFISRPNDGQIDIGAFEFVGPSGTSFALSNKVEIYPNPSFGEIHILRSFDEGEMNIILFNSEGHRLLTKQSIKENTTIHLEHLSPGIYFLQLNGPNYSSIRKLILQ